MRQNQRTPKPANAKTSDAKTSVRQNQRPPKPACVTASLGQNGVRQTSLGEDFRDSQADLNRYHVLRAFTQDLGSILSFLRATAAWSPRFGSFVSVGLPI